MTDAHHLVTTSKAADVLHVDPSTLRRYVRQGRLTPTAHTPTGHARWDLDDLRRQLAQQPQEEHVPEPATTPEHQPVVAAIVTSARGLLMGQRRDGKPPWTFIAGEIEPGESQADAAVREVKEETGLVVVAGERELGRRVHPKTRRTMIYLACAPTNGLGVFVGDEDELLAVEWVADLGTVDERMPGMYEPVHAYIADQLALVEQTSAPARNDSAPTSSPEGLVGTGAAAAAVQVSVSVLKKWAREGQVAPAERVGSRGDMRWDVEQLREQMAAGGLRGRV